MDSSTTRTDLVICKYISQAMEANGITQADLSKALEGRSKGYISDRVLGSCPGYQYCLPQFMSMLGDMHHSEYMIELEP